MVRLQQKMKSGNDAERRKGIPWTEEEHRLFLMGLSKFGKGDWRSISRNFVISRTPTQASQENLIVVQSSIMLCVIANSSSCVTSRSSCQILLLIAPTTAATKPSYITLSSAGSGVAQ